MKIKTRTINGTQVISTSDLKYCNTKYHAPYLAIVQGNEMDWQRKIYVGYGKRQEIYYDVSNLKAGDLIKAAAGSGGNKYPFTGRIISRNETEINVLEMSEIDFSNARIETNTTAESGN